MKILVRLHVLLCSDTSKLRSLIIKGYFEVPKSYYKKIFVSPQALIYNDTSKSPVA